MLEEYFKTEKGVIYHNNSFDALTKLPSKSINCIVTSPPYWGLRDYGNEDQLGLETTLNGYVENLINLFREIWRVLRDDGVVWLNLGDSYAGGGNNRGNNSPISKKQASNKGATGQCGDHPKNINPESIGFRRKSLVGVPWRVAFGLQDDGWILRQDIIWHKTNPMPESVKDRCTKSHEYIFLLTKQPNYYFDNESIKEKGTVPAGTKAAKGSKRRSSEKGVNSRPPEYAVYSGFRNKRSVWTVKTKPFKGAHFATFPPTLIEPCILAGCPKEGIVLDPFLGSGTVGIMSESLQRNWIGIEISEEYCSIAKERIRESRDYKEETEVNTENENLVNKIFKW